MKTENHSVSDVLAKNATSFFIPPFQRAYAWGRPEIERYFSDIVRIIESELDPKQHNKLEHFFGTVVIKDEKAGRASKSIIVDGQQRLTTTLLLLIALRDTELNPDNQTYITETYLINNSSSYDDKIKLKQVTKDWDAYKALVNRTQHEHGTISNAYKLLKKLINEKKKLNAEIDNEHYVNALQKMNMAVIILDKEPYKGEDPQIIFETLNSLGRPLTLSDLARNFVLLNLESNHQSDIYEKIWHPQIEEVLLQDTSKFFRDYLQYKMAASLKVVSDNNTKELYQHLKNFVETNFENHILFINDIARYAKYYKWIITEINNDQLSLNKQKDKEIKELLRNIFHDIKAEAFKPFVLGLLGHHQQPADAVKLSDDTFISTLISIRTYLIRRRVTGLTQGENRNIVLLCKKLNEIARENISMVELLSNLFYRLRLPNDTEVRVNLISKNFYKDLSQYSKFILGKIEEYNSNYPFDFRNSRIVVEQIMPQELSDQWIEELGPYYNDLNKKYLHNIGNLILTEFGNELGNKSFDEKKRKLSSSSLHFSRNIITEDKWKEENIKKHQTNMINWFIETFPLPKKYQTESNWNTQITENTQFSPLDSDAGDIAEGNKPAELRIFNSVFQVKTWQEVFIKFLVYLKEKPEYDFESILENQIELFGRDETILTWGSLRRLISSDKNLTSRYKTLDLKVWNEVKGLNDDLLFVHINISASNCMTRIANLMQMQFIDENSVKIKLKP